MVTELAKGISIYEAEKISRDDVADALDGLPPIKMQCSNLGADALHDAINNYRKQHDIPKLNSTTSSENLKKNTNDPDIELDLRGYQCPYTFVNTKIALEELEKGKVLKIILDTHSAFDNVPSSVKNQNLGEILKETEKDGEKTIWIRKI